MNTGSNITHDRETARLKHSTSGRNPNELKAGSREHQKEKARRDVAAPKVDRSVRAPTPLYKKPGAGTATPNVNAFTSWIDLNAYTATLTAKAIVEACPARYRPVLSQRCEAIRAINDELDDLIERPASWGTAA